MSTCTPTPRLCKLEEPARRRGRAALSFDDADAGDDERNTTNNIEEDKGEAAEEAEDEEDVKDEEEEEEERDTESELVDWDAEREHELEELERSERDTESELSHLANPVDQSGGDTSSSALGYGEQYFDIETCASGVYAMRSKRHAKDGKAVQVDSPIRLTPG